MWVWMSMSPRRDERAAGVDHVGGLIGEALAHRGHLTAVEGDVAPAEISWAGSISVPPRTSRSQGGVIGPAPRRR
jgi:hypothetical protein